MVTEPVRTGVATILLTLGGEALIGWSLKQQAYGPPGGAVERGEHPTQAAMREISEETGLARDDLRTPEHDVTPLNIRTPPRWTTCNTDRFGSWVTLIYRVWVPGRLTTSVETAGVIGWEWVSFLDLKDRQLVPSLAPIFDPTNPLAAVPPE